MPSPIPVLRVAVAVPRRQLFDYLPPDDGIADPPPGTRVRVPFGRRTLVGVVMGSAAASDEVPVERLRRVLERLDDEPLLPAKVFELLLWAASYYHHPVGEVLHAALPGPLRRGRPAETSDPLYRLSDDGQSADPDTLGRAVVQRRLLGALGARPDIALDPQALRALSPRWRVALTALMERGWVEEEPVATLVDQPPQPQATDQAPQLSDAQGDAVNAVLAERDDFQTWLLQGITGSGKTEVYLHIVESILRQGRQALVLVPEIALTPQLVTRFAVRLGVPLAVFHSGLGDGARHRAWADARSGRAPVVLGTRSAVFTPLARPGVIIVDEEHDGSYKQQEGFRYHARDVAVMRASMENVPVVLGSATPALETLARAREGRYRLLELPSRAGSAALPAVRFVDLRQMSMRHGLSPPLVAALAARLERSEQSLIFLNRRGFAPVLHCHRCGWCATCHHCDARLVLHRQIGRLRCHHCAAEQPVPKACPSCGNPEVGVLGAGTQRIEEALTRLFPGANIVRVDRDTAATATALEDRLASVRDGSADILVGTQMLSKGHDFPNVTLVGVLNADQGLFSVDFRATERLIQQILQVAGRAGRADKPGEVLIQTLQPDNPCFGGVRRHDYQAFAAVALAERRSAACPPYVHYALLRCETTQRGGALQFLAHAREAAMALRTTASSPQPEVFDPVPAVMERRAGRYRAQLLISCSQRRPLHELLAALVLELEALSDHRRTRWSLDVDPVDMY